MGCRFEIRGCGIAIRRCGCTLAGFGGTSVVRASPAAVNSWNCASSGVPSLVSSDAGAVEHQPAFVDEQHAAGHRLDFLQNVGRQQDRLALAQPADRVRGRRESGSDRGRPSARRESARRARAAAPGPCRRAGESPWRACRSPCRSRSPGRTDSTTASIRSCLSAARQAAGVGKELQQAAGGHVGIQRPVFRQIAQHGPSRPAGRWPCRARRSGRRLGRGPDSR